MALVTKTCYRIVSRKESGGDLNTKSDKLRQRKRKRLKEKSRRASRKPALVMGAAQALVDYVLFNNASTPTTTVQELVVQAVEWNYHRRKAQPLETCTLSLITTAVIEKTVHINIKVGKIIRVEGGLIHAIFHLDYHRERRKQIRTIDDE